MVEGRENQLETTKLAFHEAFEPFAAAGMSEFAQRLGLDLPNTLARNGKLLTHFFEGVIRFFPDAETHSQYLLFPRRQCCQDFSCLLLKVDVHHRVRGLNDPFVLDKIAEMAIFLFPDGRFQ